MITHTNAMIPPVLYVHHQSEHAIVLLIQVQFFAIARLDIIMITLQVNVVSYKTVVNFKNSFNMHTQHL